MAAENGLVEVDDVPVLDSIGCISVLFAEFAALQSIIAGVFAGVRLGLIASELQRLDRPGVTYHS